MDFDNILESKGLRIIALLVGLYSGAAKIIDFLAPPAVQPILTGLIIVTALYFFALFLSKAKQFLISTLSRQVMERLQKNPTNWEFLDHPKQIDLTEAEQAYKFFAGRYGLGNKLIEVEWTIHEDGGAILTRRIEAEAYSVVDTIETYLAIPEQASTGEKRGIGFIDIQSLGSNRVFDVNIAEKDRRSAVSLKLYNPLVNGESFGYQMQEYLSPGLYSIHLTEKEQQERTDPRFDYTGWNINLPTRKAKLKVYFPQNFKPLAPFTQVRYASSAGFPIERTQAEETSRLRDRLNIIGPEGGRYTLSLEVDYPIVGFIYMIGWKPQTSESTSPAAEN